jgi:ABC-type Mn2+/Zn2+ transport system ATPase subunit
VSEPLLALDGVAASYGGADAVTGVGFTALPGQRIGVLGPNGGGKTTLFRVLTGELPYRGALRRAGRCSVVPQTERSRLDFPVSALDVVLMGTVPGRAWWRRASGADRDAAREALAAVGLPDRAAASFGALSGGQRQRVLIARALVQDARILLLDEPFSGLDATSAERLEALIAELAGGGRGVLIATHDLDQARSFDRVLCLNRRQVAFGTPDVLTRSVLEETYGGAIVAVEGLDGPSRGILPAHHHDHGDDRE